MRLKKGFVEQQVGEKTIIVSTGELSKEFHGMIELNYTGTDIWNYIKEGFSIDETAEKLAEKYNIDISKAKFDVTNIVEKMIAEGVFEDE